MKGFLGLSALVSLFALCGCAGKMPVRAQEYAALQQERTFEHEFSAVWRAIEATVKNYQVSERDPAEVDELALRKLTSRKLKTDWILSQSRDKYVEYTVNGSPRRKPLQTRFRFALEAKAVVGGTHVSVSTTEEIGNLHLDGTPAGYERMSVPDSSRGAELLEKINLAVISAAP